MRVLCQGQLGFANLGKQIAQESKKIFVFYTTIF